MKEAQRALIEAEVESIRAWAKAVDPNKEVDEEMEKGQRMAVKCLSRLALSVEYPKLVTLDKHLDTMVMGILLVTPRRRARKEAISICKGLLKLMKYEYATSRTIGEDAQWTAWLEAGKGPRVAL